MESGICFFQGGVGNTSILQGDSEYLLLDIQLLSDSLTYGVLLKATMGFFKNFKLLSIVLNL